MVAPYLAAFDRLDLPRLKEAGDPCRAETFRLALELLSPSGGLLIETGTLRSWKAGAGTIVLGRAAKAIGQRLLSIDQDTNAIVRCRRLLRAEGIEDGVGLVPGESVSALEAVIDTGARVDLLYLDSMDSTDPRLPYQLHSLKELLTVYQALAPGAVVLLDDDEIGWEGKAYLTRRYLQEDGWVCRLHQYQSVWTRGGE